MKAPLGQTDASAATDFPFSFPFVIGCAKSGTTLLRAMLDSHPQLAIPPESYFVARLARQRRRFEAGQQFALDGFIASLIADKWFRSWAIPDEILRRGLRDASPGDLPAAVRALFALYARRLGKTRYGDKTPAYIFDMQEIGNLLPESRFVHLIRDGRDVSLSLLSRRFAPNDLGGAALFWKKRVGAGRRAGRKLGSDRYLELRYEDLLDDPEKRLKQVCEFLTLDFDPAMLRYPERSAHILKGVPRPDHHEHLRLPPTKGLRDWREQMTQDDLVVVEALVGDALGQFGYELASQRRSIHARVDAAQIRLVERLRSVASRARGLVRV